jgi:hypothetical protein
MYMLSRVADLHRPSVIEIQRAAVHEVQISAGLLIAPLVEDLQFAT